MTQPKDFNNESQDARRRDQHNATHPTEKVGKNHEKSNHDSNKSSDTRHNKRK